MMDSKMTRRDLLVTTGTVALAGWVSTEGAAAAAIGTTPLAFVDGLPVSSTQKIHRRALKELVADLFARHQHIDTRSLKKRNSASAVT